MSKDKTPQRLFKVEALSGNTYNVVADDWTAVMAWVDKNFNSAMGVKSITRQRGIAEVHTT